MVAAAITAPLVCPTCKGPVDVRSRHVTVAGGSVRVYCSADCLSGLIASSAASEAEPPPRPRVRRWSVGAIALGAALATAYVTLRKDAPQDLSVPAPSASSTVEAKLVAAPAMPVIEAAAQREQDKAIIADLARDAWIHPLAGPTRRMPVTHNGAFGAERAGERPPECVSGHCGVDLGRTWGEPVYAVHEGVIDLVQRGSNDDRGGMFVRIAHRNGTLFSWYFHLAAIPRSIAPGVSVSAGRVIGLLGDTGVKHSEPHLHFALSARPSKGRERYLDPEPLIAIWPLWLPKDGTDGHVSTANEPGIPVRGPAHRKQTRSKPPDVEPTVPDPPAAAEPAALP